ncbi:VOC family protein [Streptomyces sp. NPDC087425]|uniref:VOC family protein n=1 Tax=unclassified Streptomyces TaxID=2593676 RepID=UPI00380D3927
MSPTAHWAYLFIDRPASEFDRACDFWAAVTGTRLSELRGDNGEFGTLLPEGADASVKVQGVASGPGGAHLDLCVADVDAFVEEALRLGADRVLDAGALVVLRSPGGQLFCAVGWDGETVRAPVVRGARLDQVCFDVPPSRYDAEVAFWSGLLPDWESRAGSLPEFHALVPPPGFPVRVLLQRLGDEGPGGAHLDLACADVDATAAAHERLGARVVSRHPFWTVLRDPANGTYCLTGRDPWTGGLPAA